MRIFVLTATYELRVNRKTTYVTTLLYGFFESLFHEVGASQHISLRSKTPSKFTINTGEEKLTS
jgi:hypothetical protein